MIKSDFRGIFGIPFTWLIGIMSLSTLIVVELVLGDSCGLGRCEDALFYPVIWVDLEH